jgi:hypothetical protein
MNKTQFDHLTRVLGNGVSRRGMLRSLAGGGLTLGLVGWTDGHDAAAKTCQKIDDKKKRKACLKKARGTTASLPVGDPPPPPASDLPVPSPPPPPPPPLLCPSGTFAFAGRCAPNCGEACTTKGGTCLITFEFVGFCFPNITSCAAVPTTCSSHDECGAQELCGVVACGPADGPANRCVPFLV